jgi:hypothetical protein
MDGDAQRALVSRARAAVLLAGLLALAPGCANPAQVVPALVDRPAPPVAQVVAIWSPQVVAGVDPAHNGAPMYGLAGRVFLFGADFKDNLLADGRLVVELYAAPPGQPQAPAVKLETWEIKKEILNGVYRRTDGVGAGYSLSLPWPSYRPDITQVQIQMRYEPERGVPVYAQNTVALTSGPGAAPVYSNRMETGDRQPIVTGVPPPGAVPPPGVLPPPRGGVQPAGGVQYPGGAPPGAGVPYSGGPPPAGGVPPASGMSFPGSAPPAGGVPPGGVTQAGGTFAPPCVVQPTNGMPGPYQTAPPPPGALPQQGPGGYQTAPQPFGAYQPQPPAQGPYQVPQPPGGFQR